MIKPNISLESLVIPKILICGKYISLYCEFMCIRLVTIPMPNANRQFLSVTAEKKLPTGFYQYLRGFGMGRLLSHTGAETPCASRGLPSNLT